MQTQDNEELLKEVAELLEKSSDKLEEELVNHSALITRRLQAYRRARLTLMKTDPQWLGVQTEVDRLTVELFIVTRQLQTFFKLKYETFRPFYLSDLGIYPS